MSDEQPPDHGGDKTPAERAGATPLDPELFRASAGPHAADRRRPLDEAGSGPPDAYEVRRRRRRRQHSARPWFGAAAALAVVAVLATGLGLLVEGDTSVAEGGAPELVLSTPVASARRVPELLVRPVAARNLNSLLQPLLDGAPVDICLEARDTGAPAALRNQTAPLTPASNMKLVVAAAALDVLGPDTRLTTRFATDGSPTDGATVQGNLYMIGGGDPLLTTDSYEARLVNGVQPATDLESVADQIVDTGVRRITGSVVGDESRYDTVRSAPSWPARFTTQGQVAPLSALLVNDGWSSSGGPVGDPALHGATVLTDLLTERGIEIDGSPEVGVAPASATTLTEIPSLPVAELVAEALRFSDNTTTDLLVKELGVSAGAGGSTVAGLDVVRAWIAESSLPADGVSFDDGSGLSANDKVTCEFLSALLAAEGSDGTIANGLARPGEPGTLDDRFLSEPLRSGLRAKTGTLLSVTALSGWLRTGPGADLSYSLIINTGDRNVADSDLSLQRKILEALLTYPDAPPVDALVPTEPVPPRG